MSLNRHGTSIGGTDSAALSKKHKSIIHHGKTSDMRGGPQAPRQVLHKDGPFQQREKWSIDVPEPGPANTW